MARPKRRPSDADRDERRRRDRERLAGATGALLSSDGWAAWLRAPAPRCTTTRCATPC
jgi:hypothetical protein